MKWIDLGTQKVVGYTTGDVAKRLNRSALTIRLWERLGVVPPPLFRSSRKWRIYTSEEVTALEKALPHIRVGVKLNDTKFPSMVQTAFAEIHEKLRKLVGESTTEKGKKTRISAMALEDILGLSKRGKKQ